MTTILIIFIIALILSLLLTPVSGKLGKRFGAMDTPDKRKMHSEPIPRTGGIAVFISFIITLLISRFFNTSVSDLLIFDRQFCFLISGALVCFGVGLIDDFHRLGPNMKFIFQIIAGSIAFMGGLKIGSLPVIGINALSGPLSYLITVFWFVIFINAVNLVDGLDGLAGGIAVFASVVMVILSVLNKNYLMAMLFASLGGSVLGFLRYNFNPASIFLGDGGSYFLGYAIAGFSIIGSVKSQVGAAMLIPVLALGVPLFDTILSPIRRFVRGKKMFRPDNGHVHHRLVSMGIDAKKVVFIIYSITFGLCVLSVILVNIRNETAGLFLIVLGAGVILFVRKLGYFEYIGSDKIYGWFKDITDEAGLSRDRRSFLSLQIEIGKSNNPDEMWKKAVIAFKMLEFDMAEMNLFLNNPFKERLEKEWVWTREGFETGNDICKECLLKLELPLLNKNKHNMGTMWLIKDLGRDGISHYTLRRVEHLRRSLVGTLEKLYTS